MNKNENPIWYLYIIRCSDDSLYTGITLDLHRRLSEHQEQGYKCAKYLRGRHPLELVYSEPHDSKQNALRAEIRIKKLTKLHKELLISKL